MLKMLNGGDAMRSYREIPMPTQRWMGAKRRAFASPGTSTSTSFPTGLTYTALDPQVDLHGQALLAAADGPADRRQAGPADSHAEQTYDEVTEQEFSVPQEAVQDGRIVLNWENPDERGMNWRQQHYVTDIWVIRHAARRSDSPSSDLRLADGRSLRLTLQRARTSATGGLAHRAAILAFVRAAVAAGFDLDPHAVLADGGRMHLAVVQMVETAGTHPRHVRTSDQDVRSCPVH